MAGVEISSPLTSNTLQVEAVTRAATFCSALKGRCPLWIGVPPSNGSWEHPRNQVLSLTPEKKTKQEGCQYLLVIAQVDLCHRDWGPSHTKVLGRRQRPHIFSKEPSINQHQSNINQTSNINQHHHHHYHHRHHHHQTSKNFVTSSLRPCLSLRHFYLPGPSWNCCPSAPSSALLLRSVLPQNPMLAAKFDRTWKQRPYGIYLLVYNYNGIYIYLVYNGIYIIMGYTSHNYLVYNGIYIFYEPH